MMLHWLAVACSLVVIAATARGDDAADGPLRFLRVHVPHGKLADVDLGGERYVPMSADEFAAGVARLSGDDGRAAGAGLGPLAESARYEANLVVDASDGTPTGRPVLAGTASWTVRDVGASRSMPVGGLHVGRASMRTAAGTGDALVFGKPDGTLGIATPEPGDYACEWRCAATDGGEGGLSFRLPLVPALATAIEMRLPVTLRPLVAGVDVQPVASGDDGSETTWRIDVGPRRAVMIVIVPRVDGASPERPRVRVWSDVAVRGREARLAALVEPVAAWRPAGAASTAGVRLALTVPADAIVADVRVRDADTGAEAAAAWMRAESATEIEVTVPSRSVGSRDAVVVEAVAPMEWTAVRPLPLVTVPATAWAGGGVAVRIDAALVVSRVDVQGGIVVAPEVAARWPAPMGLAADEESLPGVRPARLFIEQQEAAQGVRVALEPRVATLAVSRVTVVDVSPGTVLGRATCEIGVSRGEAFEVRGRLAKGWVLDTVEAVASTDAVGESPEWKVVRDGADDVVRIAFTTAVSPRRGLTLRLTGHRAGVPPGVDITSAELDMVRFEGEGRTAVLAVKTGPEMTIDLVGDEPPLVADDSALAALAADTSIRVRLPAGSRASERVMRLVRRRPPLDARTQVRVTARDGRLTESFTFECTPQRTDIDALVVHFSTVMDDRLEWSLLPPAAGTLSARRIEPPDRRDGRAGEPIADSWIVELSPPVRDTVTIRAACTVPFAAPTPVPLAWVEGGTRQVGAVSIREAGRFRPRVVNRRLDELPPASDGGDPATATVAEFAFDPAQGNPDDPLPAAEIVPGGNGVGDDARAWAWREVNTIWCHASGTIEFETRFDLENHGRPSVTLSVPEALRVQGVSVDGELVAGDTGGGGDVVVELPVGRRFVEVVVRSLGSGDSRLGIWRIDPQAATLDVPVLQRGSRMLLAPDVSIARVAGAYRVVDDDAAGGGGWAERLLGAALRPAATRPAAPAAVERSTAAGLSPSGSVVEGYRSRTLVPIVGRRGGSGLLLVRGALVDGAAIVAAAIAFVVILAAPAARGWLVPWVCGLAAAGALWVAVPFDAVCRAACWSAVAALVVRTGGWRLRPSVAAALLVVAQGAVVNAAEPLRVYLTPIDADNTAGETALVPEPLFRALTRAMAEPAMVRVVACDVMARMPGGTAAGDAATWRMTLDVAADAGTTLVVDQGATGAVVEGLVTLVDGGPQPLQSEDGGRVARIAVPTAGRHRIELRIRPTLVRRGDVEEAVAVIPSAAVGRLTLAAAEDVAAVVCEAAAGDGPFQPARPAPGQAGSAATFDISRSTAVRLSRPVDPRLRLAPLVRSAMSRNDVFWDLDACRLIATFDVDSGNDVVRSFTVTADAALVPVDGGPSLRSLGPGRYLVERATPVRGRWTVQIPFRMPLPDPVGVFTVPSAWIDDVLADTRTTLLVPAPDVAVDVALPEGTTAAPRETDSSLPGFAWRADVVRPSGGAGGDERFVASSRGVGRPVVTVERRLARPRATQQLAVDFGRDSIRLGLQARIDSTSAALVDVQVDVPADCIVDRVELVEDRALQADAAERGPIDIRWSRVAPGTVLAVVQRPRAGRFRLEVEARLPGRPPARAALPVMRAALAGSVPMTVEWRTAAGRGAQMRASYGEPLEDDGVLLAAGERTAFGTLELAGGETALIYELGDVEPAAPPTAPAVAAGGAPAATASDARDARVEWADVFLDMDGRGRAWGKARFDVVAAATDVRLALPAGMRLFEVLVDGRAVAAVPQDDGTWLVPVFGVRWPRSVVAVFAGESGAGNIDGAPFAIAAPALVGLPCRQLAWTIRLAPGLTLRLAEPARLVDAAAVAAARQGAAERLEDEFIRAIEESDAAERSRMTDFARLRRTGGALPAEEAWTRSIVDAAAGETVHVVMDEPGRDGRLAALVVRVGRVGDPTAGARAMATLGVVVACFAAWHLAARWPRGWRTSPTALMPVPIGLAAVVWLLLLEPAWPGWVLLMVAAALVAVAWRRRREMAPAGDSTITQFAPSAGLSSWGAASTRTFLASER